MEIKWYGEEIIDDVNAVLGVEVGNVAEKVAADARRKVPVKTGTLRDTIKVVSGIRKDNGSVHLAYVHVGSRVAGGAQHLARGRDRTKAGAFYAGMVELGTSKTRKKPFLRPAIRKNKRSGMAMLNKAFGRAIK